MNSPRWLLLVVLIAIGLSIAAYRYQGTSHISGFVASHHDFVKGQRDRLYKTVAAKAKQPKTIILLSPNHYDAGVAQIQTSSQTWEVTNGEISPDLQVIKSLYGIGVAEEPGSFPNEHGIHLQLADIKQYFPKSKLVPLILKSTVSYDKVQQLEQELSSVCADCLLIASVDFSHYQPAILANLHDQVTERYLDQLDSENLMNKSEVNCPSCLAALSMWAKDHGTETFHIKDHTNSGVLINNLDIETTTHFFGWYESGKKVSPAKSVNFIFGGKTSDVTDMDNAFSQLGERTFWGSDGSFLNLQGPLSKAMTTAVKYLHLTTLADGDFDTVTGNALTLQVMRINSGSDIDDVIGKIETLKRDPQNRVVIFASGTLAVETAHKLIDSAADLVISDSGSSEVYKDKPIIGGLGNFLSPTSDPSSFLVAGEFLPDRLEVFALPLGFKNHQPYLVQGDQKKSALTKIYQPFLRFAQKTPYGETLTFPEK